MKKVVCKFGGTSLANPEAIKQVKNIIDNTDNLKIIVVSAPGKSEKFPIKVTDALILAYNNKDKFEYYINYVKSVFTDIIQGLNIYFDLTKEFDIIVKHFKKYKTKSYLISRGEYLSAKIFSNYLGFKFVDSKNLVKFTKNGKILSITYKKIRNNIKKYNKIIIPGFYGSTMFSKIKLMSRGGSDITGSIVAKAIKNSVYINWTDVNGVFDVSPELYNKPKIIKKINYNDIQFLSFYGAKVLHYKCGNVFKNGRTIIKNTFSPTEKGTIIDNNFHVSINAITLTYGLQLCFCEKNNLISKLLNKLKHEKLYSITRLGTVYYDLRISESEYTNKVFKKLKNIVNSYEDIAIYGILGDESKSLDKIKKEHKNCILKFSYDDKTNLIYSI